jgi:hypothetical protein
MKEKLRLFWVSAAEARRFVEKVTEFYNDIKDRKMQAKRITNGELEGLSTSSSVRTNTCDGF